MYTHETITSSDNKTSHCLQKSPCALLQSIHSSTFIPGSDVFAFILTKINFHLLRFYMESYSPNSFLPDFFSFRILSLSLLLSLPLPESPMFLNVTIVHSFYCWIIFSCTYKSHVVYLPNNGHLVRFQILAFVEKANMCTSFIVDVWLHFSFWRQMSKSYLVVYKWRLTFIRNHQIIFQSGCIIL